MLLGSKHWSKAMSQTLTLELPEDVYESLRQTAAQTGAPLEILAVQWLAQASQQRADDPLEQFIGAFDSQQSDWIDRHDEYLGRAAAHPNQFRADKA
jgi:hypothetical protein